MPPRRGSPTCWLSAGRDNFYVGQGLNATLAAVHGNLDLRGSNAPVAFVNVNVDALAVLGGVVNEIPMVTELERDPIQIIETGDHVHVDAETGIITVVKK